VLQREAMTAVQKRVWTPAEYLAWERLQPEKHAYYGGEVFAMAGASREHNLIVANVIGLLFALLRGRACEAYPSDMRVKVPATGLYTYPDVSVVCGGSELEDGELDTLLNPQVIVEVLSPSTEAYDRGEKFEHYRSIPSFHEYVLVSQSKSLVDHFVKQPDGSWLMRSRSAGQSLDLPSVGCVLAIDDLYLKVPFDDAGLV
jgi:Uma2 family endonuclease